MRTKNLILLLFLLFSKISYSQFYLGFHIEPIMIFNKLETVDKETTSALNVGGGVTLAPSFSIGSYKKFLFSLRPGITISDYYSGLNASLLGFINLIEENSLIAGVNFHTNRAGGGHSINSKGDIIPYIILGYRFLPVKTFPIELQMLISLNHVSYLHKHVWSIDPRNPEYNYSQYLIVKLSFGIDWKL